MISAPKHHISVQWHITTNCNNRCRHCYMYDEATYPEEKAHTLPDEELLTVLESILKFENKWNCSVDSFAVSGGDPLLRKNWYNFLSALKEKEKKIKIMGNPETLTDANLHLLRNLGIEKFQMSLDGLENTHDYFRSKGSFQRTVKAISTLENSGIPSQIMFTLYPENKNDLFPLIDYLCDKTPLNYFYFDIGTLCGNARELNRIFNPAEIKKIHEDYLLKEHQIHSANVKLKPGEKSHFFSLVHYEQNKNFYRPLNNVPVSGGCLAGWYSIVILSDGTVLSCRRLPVKVGKMPEQSFEEIFLGSELLKKLRRRNYFKQCGDCYLYQECRGCPAYVFSTKGDPFESHELCFRDQNDIKLRVENNNSEPGLDTSYAEEFEFISSAFRLDQNHFLQNINKSTELRTVYLHLIENRSAVIDFLTDRTSFLSMHNFILSEYELNTLSIYFRKLFESGFFEQDEYPVDFNIFINKLKNIQIHQ